MLPQFHNLHSGQVVWDVPRHGLNVNRVGYWTRRMADSEGGRYLGMNGRVIREHCYQRSTFTSAALINKLRGQFEIFLPNGSCLSSMFLSVVRPSSQLNSLANEHSYIRILYQS